MLIRWLMASNIRFRWGYALSVRGHPRHGGGAAVAQKVDQAPCGSMSRRRPLRIVTSSTGPTLDAVTAKLQRLLASRGEQGELVYFGCNNS